MAMKAGVQCGVKKTTPVAGAKGNLVVELECGHVILRVASSVGTHAVCPECTKLRDAAKAAKPSPKRTGIDTRDALIDELKKQNEYLRALANLAPPKGTPLAALSVVQPPPPPVATKADPPKPPDDVRECPKCKRVGLISEDFGWVLSRMRTSWRPQHICKKCNVTLLSAARAKLAAERKAAVA